MEKLEPWRKNTAYNVTEIAKATGRSKSHISYVLRHLRKPSRKLARLLIKEYGWSPKAEVGA